MPEREAGVDAHAAAARSAAAWGAVAACLNAPAGPAAAAGFAEAALAWGEAEPEVAALLAACRDAAVREDAEALRQDFDDLLRVPANRYLTPYESVYRDPAVAEGERVVACLHGPSTARAARFYRTVGLALDAGYPELPDYAGAEAVCLQYLSTREAELIEDGALDEARAFGAARAQFLREHAAVWFPEFFARMAGRATTQAYRAIGRLGARLAVLEGAPGGAGT